MPSEIHRGAGTRDSHREGRGTRVAARAVAGPPDRRGPALRKGHGVPRVIDGRAEDRHPWAVVALVVPLLFCAIVGVGVFLMFHRNMGYFKPAPSGRSAAPPPALALALAAPVPSPGTAATLTRVSRAAAASRTMIRT